MVKVFKFWVFLFFMVWYCWSLFSKYSLVMNFFLYRGWYHILKIPKKGKRNKLPKSKFHVIGVMCQVPGVKLCMWRVTCHLSPVTNAKSHSLDPPPANSPTMHSSLVCKYPRTKKIQIATKKSNKSAKWADSVKIYMQTKLHKLKYAH